MDDQIIIDLGGTPPTPEGADAERKAAEVREYNRDRKRAQRAREKAAREAEEALERLKEACIGPSPEELGAEQQRQRLWRDSLLIDELAQPIRPDTADEDGESYWATCVAPEIELFLDEHQRASGGLWEQFYYQLSETAAGKRVLEFFGVQPLDLSAPVTKEHKYYWVLIQQISGPPIPVFVNMSQAKREAVTALHGVWLTNRAARKDWRP
jgi:hypothetical protein